MEEVVPREIKQFTSSHIAKTTKIVYVHEVP